jgi:hypothetical protein
MVPKLHAKGTSFKGAAAYLLHDKGAASSGRVAWVETVNLATNNPQAAWRVMAMTAMDAARLKEQAGVKKTGRTSKEAVLHLTLAWSPDQKPDRKDMAEFARRAIAALKADDRQAMIICHTDEKHPHVHILLNRVSPTDGRMLSSSKEKLALSEIALAYEKESGAILCKERAVNAEKRKKGEYVRAEKDIPRPEYEALREAQKETEKEIPAEVQKQKPELAAQVRATMRKQFSQRLETIWEQLRPQWRALYQRQQSETEKADRQKMNFVQQLAGWFGGRGAGRSRQSGPNASLLFQTANVSAVLGDDRLRAQKQRGERAALGRTYKSEVGKALGDIRTACQLAVRQLVVAHDRGGAGAAFTPAASPAGIAPAPRSGPGGAAPAPEQTAAQRRISELAEKFRKEGRTPEPKAPSPARSRDRDRDWEHEP